MDEWILVQFPESRVVLVDDTPSGLTNKALLLQRGTHKISLGGVQSNYSPPSITKLVVNTSLANPMIFVFTQS